VDKNKQIQTVQHEFSSSGMKISGRVAPVS